MSADATPQNADILRMEDVSRSFNVSHGLFGRKQHLQAVLNVSFSLARGESLGLVGESGCGKSTLGRLASGLLAPSSGRILFQGRPLPAAGAGSWAAGKIQMVFQDPASSLDPRMTALDSVAEPLLATGQARSICAGRAEELLAIVGLGGMGHRYPHQFSGGQRQRIAVARALITHPDLIICDEPVSALDASVQAQILNLLGDVRERFHPAYLFISHDLAVIGFMCPRIMVMYLGRLVEEADREDLFAHAAHPYSRALLAAMPAGASEWAKGRDIGKLPPPLSGELPSPINPPAGCAFHPRCTEAREVCASEPPPWHEMSPRWRCRCHFPLFKG